MKLSWIWENVFNKSAGILLTFIFFFVSIILLLFFSYLVGTTYQECALNWTVIIVGASIGWMVAVMLSPDTSSQGKRLKRGAAAVSALASGYIIGKGEDSIHKLLKPEFLFTPPVGFRVLAFVASFSVSLILVFVRREYGKTSTEQVGESNPKNEEHF